MCRPLSCRSSVKYFMRSLNSHEYIMYVCIYVWKQQIDVHTRRYVCKRLQQHSVIQCGGKHLRQTKQIRQNWLTSNYVCRFVVCKDLYFGLLLLAGNRRFIFLLKARAWNPSQILLLNFMESISLYVYTFVRFLKNHLDWS